MNVTYFQLEKNPKREIEKDTDYDIYAKACYRQAKQFAYLCTRTEDMIVSEHCMAWFTNAAFACELYLKYYLFCFRIDYAKIKKEHNLYQLFTLLPESIKEEIIKNHPDENVTKEMFELMLKELGNAFIEFRYAYEKESLAFSGRFLVGLFYELVHHTKPYERVAGNDK